jgi:hypothetical protein
MPPPTPFAEGTDREWGGAAAVDLGIDGSGASGQFWRYKKLDARSGWVLTGSGGSTFGGPGWGSFGGGYQRMGKSRTLGVAIDGGWTYIRVGMPVLIPLGRTTYFYFRPTVGIDGAGMAQLPAGFQLGRKQVFRVETGIRAAGYYGVSGYLAAGGGWRF